MKEKRKTSKLGTTPKLWRETYERALHSHAPMREEMERNMRQFLGSDEIYGSEERASTVRNITYEIIESEIDVNVPSPRVQAVAHTERRDANAKAIERLCEALKNTLPFEAMNDADERNTYVYGASVWYLEWDDGCDGDSVTGGIRVHCLSPESFIPQPGIDEVEAMDYCFLRFTTTRRELRHRYGADDEELSLVECEYSYGEGGTDDDTVALTVAFYKGEEGIGKLVFSGDLLLSDIPNYYRRRLQVCSCCGEPVQTCECAIPTKSEVELISESVVLPEGGERVSVPYYTPTGFPIVIRKNTATPEGVIGLSDCERIRPQQQAINKVESRILQKLLRAGITPVIPEDASVTMSNAVFGQVIKLRPGESTDSYGKIDTTPDVSQDIEEADRLYDQAKRVLGISDALQGIDHPVAESGYARQLKISRAEGRLEAKRRLKYHAYSTLYKKIFEHYLAFSDEARALTYEGQDGALRHSEFNRADFIERSRWGEYYYGDEYLFSVDLNSGGEYSREVLWERNLSNLQSGTLGDASDPATLLRYWQSQERAHYPFAKENVEYFRARVEEKSKNGEGGEPSGKV